MRTQRSKRLPNLRDLAIRERYRWNKGPDFSF